MKYHTNEILSESDWDSAVEIPYTQQPQPAGSEESYTAQNLPPGQTLYFAIRAEDEVLNLGDISTSPSVTVPVNPEDTTPPVQSFEQPSEYVAKPGKIGIQIGNQIVAGIAPSGPADLAGLQVGDKIVTADGNALNGDNLHDVALIIGDPGTSVRLRILRGDQELEIPVTRGL